MEESKASLASGTDQDILPANHQVVIGKLLRQFIVVITSRKPEIVIGPGIPGCHLLKSGQSLLDSLPGRRSGYAPAPSEGSAVPDCSGPSANGRKDP